MVFFNTVMFVWSVCACVCGAISHVNIDDLSILCALFYSVTMCPDGCFCSRLHGVLEGSQELYIQTQTFSNSPHCGGTPFSPWGETSHGDRKGRADQNTTEEFVFQLKATDQLIKMLLGITLKPNLNFFFKMYFLMQNEAKMPKHTDAHLDLIWEYLWKCLEALKCHLSRHVLDKPVLIGFRNHKVVVIFAAFTLL